ncbi:hypothetical protein MBLNU457_g0023t1 [Dothideomycetes sp. NU457]
MLRYRRYRGFVAFAVFAIFGLYFLLAGSPDWQSTSALTTGALKGVGIQPDKSKPNSAFADAQGKQKFEDLEDDLHHPAEKPLVAQGPPKATDPTLVDVLPVVKITGTKKVAPTAIPEIGSDGVIRPGKNLEEGGQGRLEVAKATTTAAIHWTSQTEHFPVSSTIPIPSGKPSKIPRIQHKFTPETPSQKEDRLEKLQTIKDTAARSWKGYRDNAWMHDEVKPESGNFRDPFCGWAATLVDALDTLWIMGMKKEFEEAVEAVGTIDFTTSPRKDIPLFETTIRYLGGMLAAYDISGQKYKTLLIKSVELANILMGAFDTPNRMPVTYYHWMPTFASQPHRASTRVVLAEIGSLSLEFTRLAQLTKEPRYYDAIDRVTDAFLEWQNRDNSTLLPGLFPTYIDASGCEKPAQIVTKPGSGTKAYKPEQIPKQVAGAHNTADVGWNPDKSIPYSGDRKSEDAAVLGKPAEVPVGAKSKAGATTDDKRKKPAGYSAPGETPADVGENPEKAIPVSGDRPKKPDGAASLGEAPDLAVGSTAGTDLEEEEPLIAGKPGRSKIAAWGNPIKEGALDSKENKEKLHQGKVSELASSLDKRQLGGVLAESSQEEIDLLKDKETGGTTVEPAKNKNPHMPETGPGPGLKGTNPKSLSSSSQNDLDVCLPQGLSSSNKYGSDKFTLGGMADSLYEYFPKEYILLGGLEDKYRILYEQSIDAATEKLLYRPMTPNNDDILFSGEWRAYTEADGTLNGTLHHEAQHLACFVGGMYGLGAKLFNRPNDLELAIKLTEGCVWAYNSTATGIMPERSELMPCDDRDNCEYDEAKYWEVLDPNSAARLKPPAPPAPVQKKPITIDKSAVDHEAAPAPTEDDDDLFKRDLDYTNNEPSLPQAKDQGPTRTRPTYNNPNAAKNGVRPGPKADFAQTTPLSHADFVANRISTQRLPPGFTSIGARGYILRPEAIESVWYMYRITGDEHWREVGWNMWTAVAKHTRAKFGNSAIDDVTVVVKDGEGEVNLRDEEESFWLAETVKYFYLLFAEEDVVSLDEWVLNTEAHPFRRPDFVDESEDA